MGPIDAHLATDSDRWPGADSEQSGLSTGTRYLVRGGGLGGRGASGRRADRGRTDLDNPWSRA